MLLLLIYPIVIGAVAITAESFALILTMIYKAL